MHRLVGRKFRWFVRVGAALIVAIPLFILAVNWHVSAAASRVHQSVDKVPHNKVGLLLCTSKTANGRRNLFFIERARAAERLYAAGRIDCLLISGDNSIESYNEPQDMKETLITLGIPAEVIYLDYAGFSTLDSIIRAKRVFRLSRVTVVSQRFHCERALYLADNHDLDAVGFAAGDVAGPLANRVYLREYLARVKAFLDVNVLRTQPKFLGDDPYDLGS